MPLPELQKKGNADMCPGSFFTIQSYQFSTSVCVSVGGMIEKMSLVLYSYMSLVFKKNKKYHNFPLKRGLILPGNRAGPSVRCSGTPLIQMLRFPKDYVLFQVMTEYR